MAVLLIEPAFPGLDVPRMHPCQAGGIGPGAQACGATPASLWHRTCANNHDRDVRMCGPHAEIIAKNMGVCRECADRGVVSVARISPVHLLLAR